MTMSHKEGKNYYYQVIKGKRHDNRQAIKGKYSLQQKFLQLITLVSPHLAASAAATTLQVSRELDT